MTNRYFLDRIGGYDANVRASDADRERTAERLQTSHAEGRLDMAEFQQRLERSYEAKTLGELDELVGDLPRQDEHDERRSFGTVRPWGWRLGSVAPILVALILISALIGHGGFLLWVPLVFLFWRMTWGRRGRWPGGARRAPGGWI